MYQTKLRNGMDPTASREPSRQPYPEGVVLLLEGRNDGRGAPSREMTATFGAGHRRGRHPAESLCIAVARACGVVVASQSAGEGHVWAP